MLPHASAMDVMSAADRHRTMAAIRGRDTGPEVFVRHLLWHHGLRYRTSVRRLPGSPDIYLAKYSTAIFINGCFWHGHEGCSNFRVPKSNAEFWETKLRKNIERDERIKADLKEQGIKELVVWECTIRRMKKDESYRNEILEQIEGFLKSDDQYIEIGNL